MAQMTTMRTVRVQTITTTIMSKVIWGVDYYVFEVVYVGYGGGVVPLVSVVELAAVVELVELVEFAGMTGDT